MSTVPTGNFPGVSGNNETIHIEMKTPRPCIMLTPGAATEETGRYDLAWKKTCVVLNALSK